MFRIIRLHSDKLLLSIEVNLWKRLTELENGKKYESSISSRCC